MSYFSIIEHNTDYLIVRVNGTYDANVAEQIAS
jgi:hypothetical protein